MDPNAEPAPAPARLEMRHMGAVVTPEAYVSAQDVLRLQALRRNQGARSMFAAEATAQPADVHVVDFAQMQDVVNTEPAGATRTRLDSLRDAYLDLNGDVDASGRSAAEVRQAVRTAPGLNEALAHSLSAQGAQVDAAQVGLYLQGQGNTLSNGERNRVDQAVRERFANDPRFRAALRRHLSELELPQDIDATNQQIAQLSTRTSPQRVQQLSTERGNLTQAVQTFENLPPAQRQNIMRAARQVGSLIQSVPTEYQPLDASAGSIQAQLGIINARIATRQAIVNPQNQNQNITQQARTVASTELRILQDVHTNLDSARNILTQFGQYITQYEQAAAAPQRITEIDNDLGQIQQDRVQLRGLERTRDRALARYKTQMRGAMDQASRDYWSQLVGEGTALAQTEAQAGTTQTTEAQTEQTQREAAVQKILDRFSVISYMNYDVGGNGRVTGFDDEAIRQFARRAMLQGPEAAAREIFNRIQNRNQNNQNFPPDVQRELTEMMTELNNLGGIAGLTGPTWRKIGVAAMPRMMGYAYSREGLNIFNRVRFSKAEATAMAQNYGADFWTNALTNKGEFQAQADALFGKNIINLRGETHESLTRGLTGANGAEFFKKLMILLGIIALIGGGAAVLASR